MSIYGGYIKPFQEVLIVQGIYDGCIAEIINIKPESEDYRYILKVTSHPQVKIYESDEIIYECDEYEFDVIEID